MNDTHFLLQRRFFLATAAATTLVPAGCATRSTQHAAHAG